MKALRIIAIVIFGALIVLGLKSKIILKIGEMILHGHTLKPKNQHQEIKYIKTEDIEVASDKWISSSPVCLEGQENDSSTFGSSIAINDKYLAVGDRKNNKVIIYSHNENGNWIRTQEIKPPKDSIPEKIGFGFGDGLALDRDNLVILAHVMQPNHQVVHPEYYQHKNSSDSYFQGVYKTKVNTKAIVERIDKITTGASTLISIDINGEIIAFTEAINNRYEEIDEKTNDTYQAKVNILPIEKTNDLTSIKHLDEIQGYFPRNIVLDDNKMLVHFLSSSNNLHTNLGDKMLIFDLNQPFNNAQELGIANGSKKYSASEDYSITPRYYSIALSNNLIATAAEYYRDPKSEIVYFETLIQDITGKKSALIEGFNFTTVILNQNMLARISFPRGGVAEPGKFELFHIDEHLQPHLITKRASYSDYIRRAAIHDGLLATSQNNKVCLEYFSQTEQ